MSDQSGDTVSAIDKDSSKEIGSIFFILWLSCFEFISSCFFFLGVVVSDYGVVTLLGHNNITTSHNKVNIHH